jgi:hypothetical protein
MRREEGEVKKNKAAAGKIFAAAFLLGTKGACENLITVIPAKARAVGLRSASIEPIAVLSFVEFRTSFFEFENFIPICRLNHSTFFYGNM